MLRLSVNRGEMALLDDIEEVGFGELYQVCAGQDPPTRVIQLSERSANFIKALRALGNFKKVVIHEGEPSLAELDGHTSNGTACLKKIKF